MPWAACFLSNYVEPRTNLTLLPLVLLLSRCSRVRLCATPSSAATLFDCACGCVCAHTRACAHTQSFSHVWLFAAPWTVACQLPLPTEQLPLPWLLCSQEYWSGVSFPTPGDLSNPGIKPTSLASPALSGRFFTTSATWEAPFIWQEIKYFLKWMATLSHWENYLFIKYSLK